MTMTGCREAAASFRPRRRVSHVRLKPARAAVDERRVDARLDMALIVKAEYRGVEKRYRLLDVSRGGARFERLGAAQPPSLHTLVLDIGEAEPLRLLVRTVWCDDNRHAVRFVAQDDVDRLELAEHIDRWLAHLAA
jgi:hypothetical protein